MRKMTPRLWLGILVAGMVLRGGMASGYTFDRTWDALEAAVDKSWSLPANWSADTPPTANDRATFPTASSFGVQTVTVDGNYDISDLRINATPDWRGKWTFNGPSFTLTVTNDAYISSTQNGNNDFYPRFVLGGQLTLTYAPSSTQISTWNFPTANNQFNGGMDISYGTLTIAGTGNQFGGNLTVGGVIGQATYKPHVGTVQITGTGNTFATGRFTLNRGGVLTISQASDFSNVTNLLFNGGTLELGAPNTIRVNTLPAYAGGIKVQRGTLLIGAEANLGVGNTLTLGSAGSYGVLKGAPQNAVNSKVERSITLAGNGGVFDVYPSTALNGYIASEISGPGELIKRGPYSLYLQNEAEALASTYSGGTRVAEAQTFVDSFRGLGTGDVVVDLSAHLSLKNSDSVAPGAAIHVGHSGIGGTRAPACLRLYDTGANAAYTLTTNSSGMLALDNLISSAAINSWLGGSAPGDGTMFLGSVEANGTYSGTSLAAGAGDVYRLAAMNGKWLILDSDANSGTGAGPLVGNNSLEVGLPYFPYTPWSAGGVVALKDANTYSGTTTVHYLHLLYAYTQTPANASPIGDPSGPIVLNGSKLTIEGWSNTTGQPITKGDLTFHGSSYVGVRGKTGAVADFTVHALDRQNRSVLRINGELGGLADYERFKVATGAPIPVYGMVAPYYVGYYDNRFLTYDATVGFSNAVLTAFASAGSTDIADVTGPVTVPGGGKEVYALKASAAIGGTGILTNGSGGVILASTSTHSAPMDFGAAEAVIYVPSGITATWSGPLSGFGGLTKAGAGTLLLSGDNSGLSGLITINEGVLQIKTIGALGSSANDVVLNGGTLEDDGVNISTVPNAIRLGPLGGRTSSRGNRLRLTGGIHDLIPGQAGPLFMAAQNQPRIFGNNTYTGGTVIEGGNPRIDSGDPSLMFGTGPVRIRGAGSLDLYSTTKMNSNARWTLETSQSALKVDVVSGGGITLGSLEGVGSVVLGNPGNGASQTFLFTLGGDDTDSDYYGTILEGLGSRCSLLKKGAGTFTMWGDNLYYGWTAVTNSGTLVVNGSLDFSSAMTVYEGATLKGKGSIAAPVTLKGGYLEGSLSVGGLTLTDGSTFVVDLDGDAPRSEYDQVQVNGPVTLQAGTALVLNLGFAPTPGQTFTILNNASGSGIVGTFDSGGKITVPFGGETYAFSVDYEGGVSGHDIVLTCLPRGSVIILR